MITIEPQTKRVRIVLYEKMKNIEGWKIGLPKGVIVTELPTPYTIYHIEDEAAIQIAIIGTDEVTQKALGPE